MKNEYDYDNEIIEVNDENSTVTENSANIENLIQEEVEKPSSKKKKEKKKKDKKPRRSPKEIWMDLSKKQRIIAIVGVVLVLLIIIGLIIYFVFIRKDEEEVISDPVVIESENYRYDDGKLIFLDSYGNELGEYECIVKDSASCYVAINDLSEDSFDRIMNVYEDETEIKLNTEIYYEKYVFVSDNDTIYLYDMEDKENLLEIEKVKVYDTESNLAVITTEDEYGLIEITESGYDYLIECKYDYLGIVNTEEVLLVAQDGNDNYIINASNKILSESINAEIRSVSDSYIAAYKSGSYYLYTYDYEEVASDYDFISFHDNVIALVNNKKLYLIDESLNKLYEDGIKLTNTTYMTRYIYDSSNTLVDTEESYSIEVNSNKAYITIDGKSTEVNILEGEVSATLSYVSYYGGNLYFYSDIDKEDIMGTYTCTNKNIISSVASGLTNCYVYKTSDGYSGIYNNEYVFIYDNLSSNGDVVYYLYDITSKSVKGTYSEINIVNSEEINSEIKPVYTSSSYIIAKSATGSNKGNYGVLEINSSKVQGKVSFNYTSIEEENGYYLLINTDGTYSIYDSNFTKVSNEFSYVKLYSNYYAGVTDGKLNIYSYTNTLGILQDSLSVNSNDFTIDFTNGFTITVDGYTHTYDKNGALYINDGVEEDTDNED